METITVFRVYVLWDLISRLRREVTRVTMWVVGVIKLKLLTFLLSPPGPPSRACFVAFTTSRIRNSP